MADRLLADTALTLGLPEWVRNLSPAWLSASVGVRAIRRRDLTPPPEPAFGKPGWRTDAHAGA
jgi:hypothetical protein